MWLSMILHSISFFKDFDKLKRALNINDTFLLVLFCLQASWLYARTFNNRLCALTTSKWVPLILTIKGWIMLLKRHNDTVFVTHS